MPYRLCLLCQSFFFFFCGKLNEGLLRSIRCYLCYECKLLNSTDECFLFSIDHLFPYNPTLQSIQTGCRYTQFPIDYHCFDEILTENIS